MYVVSKWPVRRSKVPPAIKFKPSALQCDVNCWRKGYSAWDTVVRFQRLQHCGVGLRTVRRI